MKILFRIALLTMLVTAGARCQGAGPEPSPPIAAPAPRVATPKPSPAAPIPARPAPPRGPLVQNEQLGRLVTPTQAAGPPAAPLSLTASDGTGLELLSLTASAVVEGPLAFTELHLVFQNPKEIQIEGRFAITLPVDAAISRFAMLLSGGWQEAEVVERQAARRAYEDFLHRRQDPALLEHAAGNEFSARVFPIPAYGRKEIKLSYSQELRAADGA